MRVKANLMGDVATIKLLIKHPMHSGRNKNESGELIPAHYVTKITGHIAGTPVFEVNTGVSVSKNPFIQIILNERSVGDKIDLKWVDSSGASEEKIIVLE